MSTSDTPQQDQEVEINYTITTSTGVIVDTTFNKASFCYILGTNKIHKEIDTAIASMHKGEKRKLILTEQTSKDILNLYNTSNIKDETTTTTTTNELIPLTCEIELIDYYPKIKSVFEMDTNEKMNISKKYKEEGVTMFKQAKYVDAIDKFKEGISYLDKVPQHEVTADITTLKVSQMLNICNCSNKIKDYMNTIKTANDVVTIQNDNVKAFYYRANAYAYLDEFDNAEGDYVKLVELMKNENDPGVIALRKLIDVRKKEKENKDKSKYKSIFKKGIYDDVK